MRSQTKELEEFKARTQELDKVAKMLVRRDLELSETRAKREEEQAKAEQLKNEFVSLAAHQLRTPLSAIKWALEALLDGDAGPLTRAQRELLLQNKHSNERMIALINNLLDVTRIEEGRYLYRPVFSQLEELVQGVVLSYGIEARRRSITLVFDPRKEKFPRVLVDKEKILLVIQNLVDNSLRYTPPGGRVEVALSHDKKDVVFSIRDSGIGIPEEQKERIFEKFFRASNAKQVDTEGTGLGLYFSKNIIEAHEGKIWAEPKTGEGSTFFFSLPIKQEV
ncbi:MAG: PAS/PAC sensor signal transduction histidine kinase [Parcubacteria group bacterium Greene0714_21]|nr:MAG: PAS/PAC sensor signal transduction histidine kinase [Parcubacteria group bacterium Greene1014_47]TSD03964.1 MAG: PAS/PAC sensor signal transduction histidine kinase [Parcubacteria group bacterium Greene0714_21]